MGARGVSRLCLLAASAALVLPAGARAGEVFVSNSGGNTISLFSTTPTGALGPLPVSCGPSCNTFTSPRGIAVTPDGRFLYVPAFTANKISPYTINGDGSLTAPACPGTTCDAGPTPTGPEATAVSPNGQFLYLTGSTTNKVLPFAIRPDGSLISINCEVPNCDTRTAPAGVAVTPNGRFLYAANSGSASVSAYGINGDGSLAPIACPGSTCTTGMTPDGVTVSPDGRFLYAANFGSNSLSAFSIGPLGRLTPIPCGGGCDAGMGPQGVAASPNGRFVYATNSTSGTVSPFAINPNGSLTEIACPPTSCATGSRPEGLAISPNSRFLYVANHDSASVSPFAIGAGGDVTPIACAPADCATGMAPGLGSVAIGPDQAPRASFTTTTGFAGKPTRFNGSTSSASAGQTVARYDWVFGDGHVTANGGSSPSHVYAKPGTYTVSLTVIDDAGCSTAQTYTGQTASCNGGPAARALQSVTVTTAPPNTKIKRARVNSRKGSATFEFKAKGTAKRFQCALSARKHGKPRAPKFRLCTSPKAYKHLKPGRYTFEVRAIGIAGPDPSPAKRRFRIR